MYGISPDAPCRSGDRRHTIRTSNGRVGPGYTPGPRDQIGEASEVFDRMSQRGGGASCLPPHDHQDLPGATAARRGVRVRR